MLTRVDSCVDRIPGNWRDRWDGRDYGPDRARLGQLAEVWQFALVYELAYEVVVRTIEPEDDSSRGVPTMVSLQWVSVVWDLRRWLRPDSSIEVRDPFSRGAS